MSYVEIVKEHILNCDSDCIVIEVNDKLKPSSSIGRTVCKRAGNELITTELQEYKACNIGEAVFTHGYSLKQKGIIHAITPIWSNGFRNEPKLVYDAYLSSFDLAVKQGFHSIALPLFSVSSGYPANGAVKRAILACQQFISNYPTYNMVIQFALQEDLYIDIFTKQLLESGLPTKPNSRLETNEILLLESIDLRLLNECIQSCMNHPVRIKNYERIFLDNFDKEEIDRESYIHKLPSEYNVQEIANELNYIYQTNTLGSATENYYLLKLLLRIDDLLKTL